MGSNLLVDITSTSSGAAPESWGTIPSLSATNITVGGTDSVCLIVAHVKILDGSDKTIEFRLSVNGSPTGSPVLTSFIDGPHGSWGGNGGTIIWAVEGLSGSSNSFAVEWQIVSSTPVIDITYEHTLQVIEIADGDASIKVDQSSTGSATSIGSWANLFSASDISIVDTSSIILMIANVNPILTGFGDTGAEYRFSVDGTREGAFEANCKDSEDEGSGFSAMHVLDGLAAGSHSFELQWQTRGSAQGVDTTRLRTFQVIEITANAVLQVEALLTSGGTATGTYGTMTGMTGTYTPAASSSINIVVGNIVYAATAKNSEAAHRINIAGSQVGSEIAAFQEGTGKLVSVCQIWAGTGLTTSTTFKWEWIDLDNFYVAALDTGRTRSFFVLELTQGEASTEVDRTYTLDTPFQDEVDKTYTIDAPFKELDKDARTYTIDAPFKELDKDVKTYTLDAYFSLQKDTTYTIDVPFQGPVDKTYTLDTPFIDEVDKTYTIDVPFKELDKDKTYTLDVSFTLVPETTYTLDVPFIGEVDKTYTLDEALQGEVDKTYTIDSAFQGPIDKTYTIDTPFKGEIDKTYTLDVGLEGPIDKTYTLDEALKQTDVDKTYTLDSSFQGPIDKNYTLDSPFQDSVDYNYTLDVRFISGGPSEINTTYTLDVMFGLYVPSEGATNIILETNLTISISLLAQNEVSVDLEAIEELEIDMGA